jgi:hypothetical protein
MEDVGTFDGDLVHFTVFCYILWTFGKFCGNLVYFSRFDVLHKEKSGNPAVECDWKLSSQEEGQSRA